MHQNVFCEVGPVVPVLTKQHPLSFIRVVYQHGEFTRIYYYLPTKIHTTPRPSLILCFRVIPSEFCVALGWKQKSKRPPPTLTPNARRRNCSWIHQDDESISRILQSRSYWIMPVAMELSKKGNVVDSPLTTRNATSIPDLQYHH